MEHLHNELFDQLNSTHLSYFNVERLYLETDHIHKILYNILKFQNWIELTGSGSRLWDLNLINVPNIIKVLLLIEQTNL